MSRHQLCGRAKWLGARKTEVFRLAPRLAPRLAAAGLGHDPRFHHTQGLTSSPPPTLTPQLQAFLVSTKPQPTRTNPLPLTLAAPRWWT